MGVADLTTSMHGSEHSAGNSDVYTRRGRFVRVSANYIVNQWSGTSITVMELAAGQKLEQELLLRFAMSL